MRLLRPEEIRSVVQRMKTMKVLQQIRYAQVIVVSETGARIVPRPYWLTVAAAETEAMLENYKTIFGSGEDIIRIVEKEMDI